MSRFVRLLRSRSLARPAGQISLGIATLLLVVPVPLAAAHQAGAVLLFTASLVTLHALRDPSLRGPASSSRAFAGCNPEKEARI